MTRLIGGTINNTPIKDISDGSAFSAGGGAIIPTFAEIGTASSWTQIAAINPDMNTYLQTQMDIYPLDSNGHFLAYQSTTSSGHLKYRGVTFDANDNPTFNSEQTYLSASRPTVVPAIKKNGNYYTMYYDNANYTPVANHTVILRKHTGWDGTTLSGTSTLATFGPTTNISDSMVGGKLFDIPWETNTFLFTPTQGGEPSGIEFKVFDASSDTVVSTATSQSRSAYASRTAWAIGLNSTIESGLLILSDYQTSTFGSYYVQPFTISSGSMSFSTAKRLGFHQPTNASLQTWQYMPGQHAGQIQVQGGIRMQNSTHGSCVPFGRGFVYFFSNGYAWALKKADGTWIYSPWHWYGIQNQYGSNQFITLGSSSFSAIEVIKLSDYHCIHKGYGISHYFSFYVNLDDEDNPIVVYKPSRHSNASNETKIHVPHTNSPQKVVQLSENMTGSPSFDYRTLPITYTAKHLDNWANIPN